MRIRNLPEESHAHTHALLHKNYTHRTKLGGYPAAFRKSELFPSSTQIHTRFLGQTLAKSANLDTRTRSPTHKHAHAREGGAARVHTNAHTHRATDVTVLLLNGGEVVVVVDLNLFIPGVSLEIRRAEPRLDTTRFDGTDKTR